jgi:hypothetical protein
MKKRNFSPVNFSEYFKQTRKISESYALRYYQDLKNNIEYHITMVNYRIFNRIHNFPDDDPKLEPYQFKKTLFEYLAPYNDWAKPENHSKRVKKFLRKRYSLYYRRKNTTFYYYKAIVNNRKIFEVEYVIDNYYIMEKHIRNAFVYQNFLSQKHPSERRKNLGLLYYLKVSGFDVENSKFRMFLAYGDRLFKWVKFE